MVESAVPFHIRGPKHKLACTKSLHEDFLEKNWPKDRLISLSSSLRLPARTSSSPNRVASGSIKMIR